MDKRALAVAAAIAVLIAMFAYWATSPSQPRLVIDGPSPAVPEVRPDPPAKRPNDGPRIRDTGSKKADEPTAEWSSAPSAADLAVGPHPTHADAAGVRWVLKQRAPALGRCWQAAHDVDTQLAGGSNVTFTIGTDGTAGRLTAVALDTAPGPGKASLEACVLKAMADASFDAPEGGRDAEVKMPVFFSEMGPTTAP